MGELFEPESAGQIPAPGQRIVGVAVATNVWRTFDYLWPAALGEPTLGQRIRVPFGKANRRTLGFITDTDRPPSQRALKPVAAAVDPVSQFDLALWKLARWIGRYYLTPLGMVLPAMVPSAVGRHAARTESVVYLAKPRPDWPASLGGRQKRILDELAEALRQGVEPLPLEELLRHSGSSRDSVRRLARRGLIRMDSRPVLLPEVVDAAGPDPFEPNDDQKGVLAELDLRLNEQAEGKFSVTLLYGVTGSGKTEVYIRAIRRVIDRGDQAILLVPEISLATQTLQRLLKRLPRVAVLHSGLRDAERAFYYEQIRDGHASVVVGPRSAVFAPTRRLALLIVDEEHESSYKQDTTPRYHARDVAVVRASLCGATVLLGSATPSLESLQNVRDGRYRMLRLPHRVRSLPLPKLQVVSLRREMQPGRIELIGRTLTHKIAGALDRREQVILLMNRRGFASYVFCPSSGWILICEQCDRPMVYHRATRLAMCHHCEHTAEVPERCPVSGGKLVFFGYGIQRIETELARKFPDGKVARMDSDTMTSSRQFREVFDRFAAGEIDILLGTQMVAKGLDFPRVSLVGVASGDTSLTIPDFRASERTFQLIVQVAGRAGRSDLPGEVIVQTLYPEEPAVRFATTHDYDGFAEWELPTRRSAHLPPFTRMVRFIIRHAESLKAEQSAALLAERLRALLPRGEVQIVGPLPCGVIRIRNRFRHQVQLTASRRGLIQQHLTAHMDSLTRGIPAEVLADADPIHLL
ncbi:MAG TPA: primosomal protein N' [Phycisphaerae bacterium]|nr:primosomal protein N' [Phycisphaerae bacterium]